MCVYCVFVCVCIVVCVLCVRACVLYVYCVCIMCMYCVCVWCVCVCVYVCVCVFRGNKDVRMELCWNVVPHAGLLPLVRSDSVSVPFPDTYSTSRHRV